MSISKRIANHYTKEGPGVEGPPPQKGFKLFAFVCVTHFWKLMQLNLLFVLFCLPIVTIPAAYAGMSRVIMRLLRDGHCFLWTDFIKEFKASFFKGLLIGLIFLLLGAGAYFLYVSLCANTSELAGAASFGFILLSFVIVFVAGCYAMPLLAMVDIPVGAVLKNAFMFVFFDVKRTLWLLATAGSIMLTSIYFLPFTLPLLACLLFSFTQLIVCALVKEPIENNALKSESIS